MSVRHDNLWSEAQCVNAAIGDGLLWFYDGIRPDSPDLPHSCTLRAGPFHVSNPASVIDDRVELFFPIPPEVTCEPRPDWWRITKADAQNGDAGLIDGMVSELQKSCREARASR